MALKFGSSDASIGGASKLMLGATQIWPASAAWLPTDLSGATTELWFDAQDAASITKDGSNLVSQWNDKSGNDHHATQATASRQLLYQASNSNIGNLPSIGTIDAGDGMTIEGYETPFPATSFVAGTYAPYGVCVEAIRGNTAPGATSGLGLIIIKFSPSMSTSSDAFWFNGALSSVLADVGSGDPSAAGYYAFVCRVRSYGLGSGNYSGRFISDEYNDGTTTLLNRNQTWSRTADVDLCELVHGLGDLSDTERQKLEGCLAHKWGLAGELPSGHPYAASPP